MKIKKTATKKPLLLATLLILFTLGLSGIAYATFSNNSKEASLDEQQDTDQPATPPSSKEEVNTGTAIKQGNVDNTSTPNESNPTPTNDAVSGKQIVGTEITGINKDGNVLIIRTLIQAIDNNGSCIITMTGPGNTYTETVSTQASARVSTCKGFNVPLSSLSSGKWSVKIDYRSETAQGYAISEVEI
jgi:hypothetical protein